MKTTVDAKAYTRMLARMIKAGGKYWRDCDAEDLTELVAARRLMDLAIFDAVAAMRQQGYSWRVIGAATGTSHVAALQKWGGARPKRTYRQIPAQLA